MDSGFRVLDSSLFQWNFDSRFHSLVRSILDSKALDSGSYEQKFRNPDTLTCGEVLVKIF